MKAIIEANKYVELTYKVIDRKTGQVLTMVEFPLGYVHGVNEILSPRVMDALEGKSEGDIIEVQFSGDPGGHQNGDDRRQQPAVRPGSDFQARDPAGA